MPDILPPVIGVDLGASFTKISYRPAWNNGNHYNEPSRMVVIEGSPLVPSLVIYREEDGQWIFGKEAADYIATPKDREYRNWKASLYSQRLDHKVDGDMDAASRFFEWLGRQLRTTGIPINASTIKICLPAFDGAAEPGRMLVERMVRCGWAGGERATIEEPKANTIGIFGEGSNSAYIRAINEILPNYRGNFPEGGVFHNHLRNHALFNGPRRVYYLIIDIGSFTTDLSFAVLDARKEGDCMQQATQHSFELGLVEYYEKPLFERLLVSKDLKSTDLTFNDRERIKNILNTDNKIIIAPANHNQVTFGTLEDQAIALSLAEEFATKLATVVQDFMNGQSVKYVMLTGGGVAITKLRHTLHEQLKKHGMNVLPNNGARRITNTAAIPIRWEETGETLERLATALGASSVLMDIPVGEALPPEDNASAFEFTELNYCSCNCNNRDCARCGGSGIIK